ncbi:hypothetical protein HMI55_003430 [Coelomomyces lativittatus]|nr:hypothetical protein HMI55_003430 [Coelomomyces lativittatus]
MRSIRGLVFPTHAVPFHPLPLPLLQLLRPKLLAYTARLQAWMTILLVDEKVALFTNEWFKVTDLERLLMLTMAWRFLSYPYFDHPILLHDTAPNTTYRLIGVQLSPHLFSVSLVESKTKIQEEWVQGQIVPLLWTDVPSDLSEPVHTKLDLNLLCLLLYFEKQGHWLLPTLPNPSTSIETEVMISHLAAWLHLIQAEKDAAKPYVDEVIIHPTSRTNSKSKAGDFRGYWKYFPEVHAHVWFLCTLDIPDYAMKRVATDCLTYFLNDVLM